MQGRIYTMSENAPNAITVYRMTGVDSPDSAQAQTQIPHGTYMMQLFLWTIG